MWRNVEKSLYLWGVKSFLRVVRMRFIGNIEAKTDSKGRAFLPAAFRKVLQASGEERLVMRKDIFQSCLVLYLESVWNEQLDILRNRLSRWNARHQLIFRQFVSDVEIVTLDSNGRFLIPRRYLRMACIGQNLKFIGMDDTIEIWSNDDPERTFMDASDFSGAIEEIMGNGPQGTTAVNDTTQE